MSLDAIKAVIDLVEMGGVVGQEDIVKCLRSAIEQAERQEPVGSFMTREQAIEFCRRRRPNIEPTEQQITATLDAYAALFGDLVPAPPQRQPLTDEEIADIAFGFSALEILHDDYAFARAIERAHGIGGEHD